ncbi:hypothetical protein [Pseudobdellovibrio exovorus]|uniref:Lipoprotein n=1 Tax=Pseudobdellovibrio exovorus JSS TaxID=1184267 RepID=M4V8I0_9BACT|nr:hypothetical protein [Pseudobdellovibrio exovorus]AGH94770.1 hypothetical protein A11Q_550 [Pseudobdellovibrio exovorus JSS]
MKAAWAYALAVLVLLVSFQNCQKPPHPDELGSQNVYAAGVVSKVDLSHESVKSVEFIITDLKSIVHTTGNTIQVKYHKVLDIDMVSGNITVTNDMDPSVENYCLTSELKAELNSILHASEVCKRGPVASADTNMCAQVVHNAYANLFTDREQFSLGYASDACGSNAIDLCGEQADLLRGYIQNLKSEYSTLSCN